MIWKDYIMNMELMLASGALKISLFFLDFP